MIQRKAFKKWLFITALCGAHSFFWGAMTKGNPFAMLLGVLTLALAFAFIESHATYQKKCAAAPRLARALDGGVKFRCWLAVYIPLSVLAASFVGKSIDGPWLYPLGAPYMGELFIGMGATQITHTITGINFHEAGRQGALSAIDNFIATYLTTIFTGLAHTIILAIMCLLAYGVVRLRSRGKPVAVDDGAAKE